MKSKSILFVLLLTVTAHVVFAQDANHFNPEKEKREVNGCTIRLVPMPLNTFGFVILKGNKSVYAQLTNTFTHSPLGFKNKEDAYKLAGWVVNEYSKSGRPPLVIPQAVGKELNLQPGSPKQ